MCPANELYAQNRRHCYKCKLKDVEVIEIATNIIEFIDSSSNTSCSIDPISFSISNKVSLLYDG